MIKQNLEEWRNEALSIFGTNANEWKFVCPNCGHIQTPGDFKAKELDPQKVYTNCIGRYDNKTGCNWAAYGFLGKIGNGRTIVTPSGDEVEVFDFAQSAIETNEQPSAAAAEGGL